MLNALATRSRLKTIHNVDALREPSAPVQAKERSSGTGLVQDHHVIPKQFKAHPIIRKTGYDVNESSNIVMMPTPIGKRFMKVRSDR